MSKKIGLVSYPASYNYGTLLQAYALACVINKLGFDAEYISYQVSIPRSTNQRIVTGIKYLFTNWKALYCKLIRKSPYAQWGRKEFLTTKKGFDDFYNKFTPHSSKIYNNINIKTDILPYDNYIVGSDQTWSPYRFSESSPTFLSFIKNTKLKNAYAPSLGALTIPDELKPFYKRALGTFNHLSCREKSGCIALESLLRRKVEHVIDPAFLLKADQWDKLATQLEIGSPYILSYVLGQKKCISAFAEKLGNEKKLPVYYIVTSPFYLRKKNKLLGVTPTQFISLIKKAEYVCTDSFHGVIFAIIYKKQFYSFMKREGDIITIDNSRIIEMLSDLNLSSRFRFDSDTSLGGDIDYSIIDKKIEERINTSMSYLKDILEDR